MAKRIKYRVNSDAFNKKNGVCVGSTDCGWFDNLNDAIDLCVRCAEHVLFPSTMRYVDNSEYYIEIVGDNSMMLDRYNKYYVDKLELC